MIAEKEEEKNDLDLMNLFEIVCYEAVFKSHSVELGMLSVNTLQSDDSKLKILQVLFLDFIDNVEMYNLIPKLKQAYQSRNYEETIQSFIDLEPHLKSLGAIKCLYICKKSREVSYE